MSVLDLILQRVGEETAAGRLPVVILDIDSTLVHTGERHRRILLDVARAWKDPVLLAVAKAATASSFVWSVDEPVRAAGITDPDLLRRLKRAWATRFFSDAFCDLDVPTPGAPAFVREVVEAGGLAVYLTGRTADQMAHGTLRLLQRWGFPVLDGRTMLVLKPDAGAGDAAWKLGVLDRLARLGPVVATFENEPGHANAFLARFPEAVSVLMEAGHSPGAPAPAPGLARLVDFRRPGAPAGP